nr:hypothetical protein [Tanacetum cinerariifolium]
MNVSSISEAMQSTLMGRLKWVCNRISFLETPTREVGLKKPYLICDYYGGSREADECEQDNPFEQSKTRKPEAPTFAIPTRLGISTQDTPFLALPRPAIDNFTDEETKKEGHEGAEPSITQEPAPRPSILYQPSKSPNLPFSSRLKKQKKDDKDERLLSIYKQIHINLPFLEAMIHMPNEAKVLKDLLSHKEKIKKAASSVKLSEECSAIIQKESALKRRDPGSLLLSKNSVDEPLEWKALENQLKPSSVEPPQLELKELAEHLEYAFLQENTQLPVVISSALSSVKKTRLLEMLERLAGHEYYCFLDGFSGYFQIPIAPEDQEKTTFTCLYGTFAYKRMPFELCNGPATFQRCMTTIFHELIEDSMEAPIMIKLYWSLPFEIMCDASDYVVRAVIGQRIDKTFQAHTLRQQNNEQSTRKEFDIEIRDKKGAENLAADHLSRLKNPDLRKLIKAEIRDLFPEERLMEIFYKNDEPCRPSEGHHGIATTARKVFEAGFYWTHIFYDAHKLVQVCDACQRAGNISSRDETP